MNPVPENVTPLALPIPDPTYPYLCGEETCVRGGTRMLTMIQITEHWKSHSVLPTEAE